jgi:hypothetical protein
MLLDLYQMEREIRLHQERLGRGNRPFLYPAASAGQSFLRQFIGSAMIRLGETIQGHAARPEITPTVTPVRFEPARRIPFGTVLLHKG